MFNKVKKSALALGCAALPFLTQVTMSGGSVALESAEVSSLGSAVADGSTSLVNMAIAILPVAIGFTICILIYGVIRNFVRRFQLIHNEDMLTRREYKQYYGSKKGYRSYRKGFYNTFG